MAYFSNSTEGAPFDEECASCKYGEDPCPIALVQNLYNYDACNNKTARAIFDGLVTDDGVCQMKKEFKKDFSINAKQGSLFEELEKKCENCKNETPRNSIICNSCIAFNHFEKK